MGFDHFLIEKGVHVVPDWAQQWQEAATSAVLDFDQKSVSVKQELLYQEVLRSNLHLIGRQALPADLQVCWSSPPFMYLHHISPISSAEMRNIFDSLHFVGRLGTKGSCRGSLFCKQTRSSMLLPPPSTGIQKLALHFGFDHTFIRRGTIYQYAAGMRRVGRRGVSN